MIFHKSLVELPTSNELNSDMYTYNGLNAHIILDYTYRDYDSYI